MKKVIIFLTFFLCCIELKSQITTIFIDNFSDFSKISQKSNSKITNFNNQTGICASNTNQIGYIISSEIRLPENCKWYLLSFKFFTNVNTGSVIFSIDILKSSDNSVIFSNITTSPFYLNNITDDSIKLKARFKSSGNKIVILDWWEIKVEQLYNPRYYNFYAAPVPFKIGENLEGIRFYYKFKKDCSIKLNIYDLNYNLVKTLQERSYSAEQNLDAVWDGKNGKGIEVLSGVYVAVLEIKNKDGSIEKPQPFVFSVIK